MSELLRGRVVTPDAVLDDGVVEVDGDRIGSVSRVSAWRADHPDDALPEPSGTLLPGLVDIHCHGGGGAVFTTSDPAEATTAAEHHHRNGTTSVMASLVTASPDDLVEQVTALAPLVRAGVVAGVHLEGPFLSEARCGAQDPALIVDPNPDVATRILDAADDTVAMMTIAPERPGYDRTAEVLRGRGVVVALGHSDADYDTFASALAGLEGTGVVTHLANGMPPFHHRAGGPVGASLVAASQRVAVIELIADGRHVDAGFVRLAFAVAGGQVALVTDAMAAAGMADGEYDLGGQRVGVREGLARLVDGDGEFGSIAGGTSRLIENVARCVNEVGIPLVDAVRAASSTPARAVGLADACGALLPGRYADVLVTDDHLSLRRVLRRGEWLSTGR
ncbi:N-acetylglucosamine-6-phosphate deacetylase [Solicola gregarius]|uniref:Amidohydrolase family protein n=1 Tax=Solicola gregarius TaxID=2908642 RepID=A0AA46TFE3_9ACTN|nr:amidohydrolase family protein [Solicola gregarius]UYM04145.1 amidohydrolase family protein [Solicola gregarius]